MREVAQKLARLPLVGSGYPPLPNSEEVTFLGYSLTTQSVIGVAIALGKKVKIRNRSRLPKKNEPQLNQVKLTRTKKKRGRGRGRKEG